MTAAAETDVVETALRVALERSRHDDPDDFEGRRRSRRAFRQWREPLPKSLSLVADGPLLVARYRDYWLQSISALVRSLDPSGLGSGGFHTVDVSDFGIRSDHVSGFTFPGLFDVARTSCLPVSARRGPTIAVNVPAIVSQALARLDDDLDECAVRDTLLVELAAVGLHEAAHTLAHADDGVRLNVPPAVAFPAIRAAVAKDTGPARRRETHGPAWVRGFAHLCRRASRRPPGDWWLDLFAWDVSGYYPGSGEDWLDALSLELATTDPDDPIAEILRRPPPPGFARLFDSRSAA